MTGPIVIRPAREDEAWDIARIHVQADGETYTPIFGARFKAVPMEESVGRWDRGLAAGDVLLVATDAGAIVGLLHASPTWMSALYLLASHHRRGVGARLLRAACAALAARGVTEIGFQAVADNAGALAFYAAMGAVVTGRKREGAGEDAWEELVFSLDVAAPLALTQR